MHERHIKHTCMMVTIIVVITCFAAQICPALAEDMKGSLTICYCVNEEGHSRQIDGAEFSLYQIADYGPNLKVMPLYGEYDFVNMKAEELSDLAEELSKKKLEPRNSGMTDRNGIVVFPDLDAGFYLVKQTGAEDGSRSYENASPFIINVPSEDGFDVICYPKTVSRKQKSIVPSTGDVMNIQGAIISAVAGGTLLIGVLLSSKKGRGDDRC